MGMSFAGGYLFSAGETKNVGRLFRRTIRSARYWGSIALKSAALFAPFWHSRYWHLCTPLR